MTIDKNIIYLLFLMKKCILVQSFFNLALRFFHGGVFLTLFLQLFLVVVSSRGSQCPDLKEESSAMSTLKVLRAQIKPRPKLDWSVLAWIWM